MVAAKLLLPEIVTPMYLSLNNVWEHDLPKTKIQVASAIRRHNPLTLYENTMIFAEVLQSQQLGR